MKNIFYYTKVTLLFLFLFSCKNKSSNIEKAKQYSKSIREVTDSLNKLKSYNLDLLICSYSEDSNYGKLMFISPSKTYFIGTTLYNYEKINGIDIIFIDYSEIRKNSKQKDEILNTESKEDNYNKIKHLVKSNKVSFGVKNTNYPFIKFVFCKKNINKINCFDNILESKAYFDTHITGEKYSEDKFYPNCN